jgi:hypothetical protein
VEVQAFVVFEFKGGLSLLSGLKGSQEGFRSLGHDYRLRASRIGGN